MKKRLGVTGGIGSGKTTVCKVFRALGIPVFTADDFARSIMDNDPEIIREIKTTAGKDLYTGGELDRKKLARLIFNEPDLLEKINTIVHPSVLSAFNEWAEQQQAPYVILEAAILYESGADKLVDRVLAVSAPLEERIARVMGRSELTRTQVLERIKNQLDDNVRNEKADFVISNADNEVIIPEILDINREMLKIAEKNR